MGVAVGAAIGTAIGTATVALGRFARDSINAASQAETALGGVQTVFGEAIATVERYASSSAKNLGLAKREYETFAAVLGAQLQRAGQSQEDSAKSTDKLITLGADLAATYGGNVSDAVAAVGSLLRGERDPIERYAVGINEATINAYLAANGLKNLKGEALAQAKTQATLALLFEQTAKVQGNATKQSDSLRGQTQRLKAQYADLSAQVGAKLLPALLGGIEKFSAFANFVQRNSDVIVPLVGAIATFTAGMFIAVKAVAAFNAISLLMGSSVTIALGPIGVIIIAIAALAAGLVLAYKKSDTFRGIVNKLWENLKRFVGFTPLGMLIKNLDRARDGAQWLIDKVRTLIRWLGKIDFPDAPGWLKSAGGAIGKIPGLASGGHVLSGGMVRVGETGPENLWLPRAATVKPLTRDSGGSGGGGVTIEAINVNADRGDTLGTSLREMGALVRAALA